MILATLVFATFAARQQIPAGVRYKKAPDAVNNLAYQKLVTFFGGDPATVDFKPMGADVVVVFPGMWNAMKAVAPKDIVDGPKASFVMPTKSGALQYEGRMLKTEKSQEFLWICLLAAAHGAKPTIRKATSDEISYYWALIPYDIEEPLYVADFGKHKFLFAFDDNAKDPRVFTVEAIGNLPKPITINGSRG